MPVGIPGNLTGPGRSLVGWGNGDAGIMGAGKLTPASSSGIVGGQLGMPEGVQGNFMGEFGGGNDAHQWKNRVVIWFLSRHQHRSRHQQASASESTSAGIGIGVYISIGINIGIGVVQKCHQNHPKWLRNEGDMLISMIVTK